MITFNRILSPQIDSTFYGFYGNHNGKSMMSFGSAGTCELICDVLDPVTKESVLPKPILVVIIVSPIMSCHLHDVFIIGYVF